MSGSITFRHGPFQGWNVALYGTYDGGELVRTQVMVETPHRNGTRPLSGLLQFSPGVDGFELTQVTEFRGGAVRMAELLEWVVEATRAALDRRTDIGAEQRAHWQAIVDIADDSRADFFARYPDGTVPAFEIIASNTTVLWDLVAA